MASTKKNTWSITAPNSVKSTPKVGVSKPASKKSSSCKSCGK